MKRVVFWSALAFVAALAVPALRADVKTQEKTTTKIEGFLGGLMNRAAGGSDGITSSIAVKGDRMATTADNNMRLVDLAEEKIYDVDLRRKEYKVMTFAELRKTIQDAQAQLEKQSQQMDPQQAQALKDAARQLEFDVDVRETGQQKTIAGQHTRETVLTITMREAGKTLEEGGGSVLTSTMWLAPRIAALDELHAFNMRFFKAAFDGVFTGMNPQQLNALNVLLPGVATLTQRLAAEQQKLQGTPLATTTVIETVRSAEQMAAAQPAQPSGGGGLGGMLAGRLMRGRGQVQARSTAMTTTHETLSIAQVVADADVTIPAGFKEKK